MPRQKNQIKFDPCRESTAIFVILLDASVNGEKSNPIIDIRSVILTL